MLSEERLRAHYRAWRRTLHKAKDYRVKVLHVLAGDGNGEAAGLLSEPARAYKAERCRECAGCLLMLREKACGECNGCKGGRGCEEHHRRCREWPRNANTFHAGSVVTSVSSQFDILTADLTKYEAALDALRDLDLELEEDMDQLSPESASRTNPRFSQEGRARELEDERNHLARLAVLLQRHGELAARLQEVTEAEEDQPVVMEPGEGDDTGLLTGTQTSRELIQMFNLESAASLRSQIAPRHAERRRRTLINCGGGVTEPWTAVGWRVVPRSGDPRPRRPDHSGDPPATLSDGRGKGGSWHHGNIRKHGLDVALGRVGIASTSRTRCPAPSTGWYQPRPSQIFSPSLRPGVPAPSSSSSAKGTPGGGRCTPVDCQRKCASRAKEIPVQRGYESGLCGGSVQSPDGRPKVRAVSLDTDQEKLNRDTPHRSGRNHRCTREALVSSVLSG